ncbi:MAG: Rieske (2Fe-2S) protein [Gemmatimonadota bacterium]
MENEFADAPDRLEGCRDGPVPAPGSQDLGRDPRAGFGRRRFLALLSIGAGGVAALLAGIPVLGAFFFSEPDEGAWRPVAAVDDLPVGSTAKVEFVDPEPLPWAGASGRSAAWLRRESETEFVAFSLYCSHTGCPVRWEEGAELFMCPCHGGAFYRDGTVASGPPPVPLERHPVRIRAGMVEVRTIGVPIPGA